MSFEGFDLEAVQEALGDHSIFAPSASSMWLFCSGSLIPHLLTEDSAGEDAAIGTVGHSVAEAWLTRLKQNPFDAYRDFHTIDTWIDSLRPREMMGRVVPIKQRYETFHVPVTDEMFSYIREYVKWCVTLPGTHYIETKVFFSQITPIPNQGGTADHAACEPGVLTITDLKYGTGVQVFARENTQALLYALGFFLKYDPEYHFERIVIRIGQPRWGQDGHWDVWETTRERLLEFMGWAKVRAHAAWDPQAPRTPGTKQCQWCHVANDCAARAAWMIDQTEDVDWDRGGSEVTVRADGMIEGVSYTVKDMQAASQRLVDGTADLSVRNPGTMPTLALERLLVHRKSIERWFALMAEELLARANDGQELELWKLVPGRQGNREWNNNEEDIAHELEFLGVPEDEMYVKKLISPAQAEEVLHKKIAGLKKKQAASLVTDLTTRQDGKPTLALITDQRDALPDLADDTFEPVSDDDDL